MSIRSRQKTRIDNQEPDQIINMLPGWLGNGSEFLFLRYNRAYSRQNLMAANSETGGSRVILTETSNKGGVNAWWLKALRSGKRFLWASQRDGWIHLYLYDMQGELIRQLTKGTWPVLELIALDEEAGWIYFTAHGDRERVYGTHLYRVDLQGRNLTCLTEETGVHDVQFSPSKRFFLDTHSTVARPPVVRKLKWEINRCNLSLIDFSTKARIATSDLLFSAR